MKRATIRLLLDTLRLRDGITPERAREEWGQADCRGLARLLQYEGAEFWFYRRIQELGVELPEAFRAELRVLVHQTSIMNMRIDAQTLAVTAMLDAAAIPYALIKGQARRAAEDRYPYGGARRSADVDLLISAQHIDAAWDELCRNGFGRIKEPRAIDADQHHRPVLMDANKVGVELHSTTATSISPVEAWRRTTEGADLVSWSGREFQVPNATELVWHGLSHLVQDGLNGFYLGKFLAVAAILAEDPAIDWACIATRMANDEVFDHETGELVARERIHRSLAIASQFAGREVPVEFMPQRVANMPALLRWRWHVVNGRYGRPLRDRLLEEGVRSEVRYPLTSSPPGTAALPRLRRWIITRIARVAYVTWRALQ